MGVGEQKAGAAQIQQGYDSPAPLVVGVDVHAHFLALMLVDPHVSGGSAGGGACTVGKSKGTGWITCCTQGGAGRAYRHRNTSCHQGGHAAKAPAINLQVSCCLLSQGPTQSAQHTPWLRIRRTTNTLLPATSQLPANMHAETDQAAAAGLHAEPRRHPPISHQLALEELSPWW